MVQVSLDQSYIQFDNHNNEKENFFLLQNISINISITVTFSQLKNNQKIVSYEGKKIKEENMFIDSLFA